MANVLGELFSDIATSIRSGLGEVDKMKPTSFPAKIDEIVALIGTGSGSGGGGGDVKASWDSYFTLSSTTGNEYTHNLGVVPDVVVVFASGGTTNRIKGAMYWSNAFAEKMLNGTSYRGLRFYYGNTSVTSDFAPKDIEQTTDSSAPYVWAANETTFKIGSTLCNAMTGGHYVLAIGGLT